MKELNKRRIIDLNILKEISIDNESPTKDNVSPTPTNKFKDLDDKLDGIKSPISGQGITAICTS